MIFLIKVVLAKVYYDINNSMVYYSADSALFCSAETICHIYMVYGSYIPYYMYIIVVVVEAVIIINQKNKRKLSTF